MKLQICSSSRKKYAVESWFEHAYISLLKSAIALFLMPFPILSPIFNNFNKVKHLNHQIRKIVISQIDFSIRFPMHIVSKKIEENIPYGEGVQFDRFEYANQPSISHLNNIGKNKQLTNTFLTAPFCSERSEKMYKVTSVNVYIDKSL